MIADFVGSRFALPTADQETISSPTPSPPACDSSVTTNYGGGAGTSGNPYRLCSLAHWNYLAAHSSDWALEFQLEADIDFTGVTDATFQTVGSVATPFSGKFNGNNFKLKNLILSGITADKSLFPRVSGSPEFNNLKLENISLTGNSRLGVLVLDHITTSGTLKIANLQLTTITVDMSTTAMATSTGMIVGQSLGSVEMTGLVANHILGKTASMGDFAGAFIGSAESLSIDGATVDDLKFGQFSSATYVGGMIGSIGTISSAVKPVGLIKNIRATNVDIYSPSDGAAILSVSFGDLTMQKVTVQGQVTGPGGQSGLIGRGLNLFPGSTMLVEESSFDGALLNGGNMFYGGLLGSIATTNLIIRKSFHKGNMSVWSGAMGGLLGYAGASAGKTIVIEDSYHIGDLTLTHASQGTASGLIGRISGPSTVTLTVSRSFAVGSHLGTAGFQRNCIADMSVNTTLPTFTFTDVYYDSTLCVSQPDVDTALGVGVTAFATAAMKTATPFTNWLSSVWIFSAIAYPKLIWEP